eukprot:scaffold6985_cov57-Phaeocystis_antarctica.AAC.1
MSLYVDFCRRGQYLQQARRAWRLLVALLGRAGGGRGARPVPVAADTRAAPYFRWAARGMALGEPRGADELARTATSSAQLGSGNLINGFYGQFWPGAATALAKVTGVIVTARVDLRAAAGCEAPPPQARAAEFFQARHSANPADRNRQLLSDDFIECIYAARGVTTA